MTAGEMKHTAGNWELDERGCDEHEREVKSGVGWFLLISAGYPFSKMAYPDGDQGYRSAEDACRGAHSSRATARFDPGSCESTVYRKSGQGAFSLTVFRSGKTVAQRDGGSPIEFSDPRAAYDWYREAHSVAHDHASWNICYHLEDHLQ